MTTAHVALLGNPNAGKSSLFNALTGSRQKVANYPGVTVERHAGPLNLADGRVIELIDLPGTYSLDANSPDEVVTRDIVMGHSRMEHRPDALICVVDATNLRNHLKFVLELRALGLPMIVALNMVDLAARDGTEIDQQRLSQMLGLPVIATVAVRRRGITDLLQHLTTLIDAAPTLPRPTTRAELRREADRILRQVVVREGEGTRWTRQIDQLLLHPVLGLVILATMLFVIFQAVFAWAQIPVAWINSLFDLLRATLSASLPDDWIRSLLNDGVITGVGSVIVFLPQILILFFFILLLEQSGYMTRAAFLMDQLMAKVGLNGRAFIPLLSSFACAVPGIMSARTIDNPRDRLTTIMIAPLMTCSARLPIYTLVIGAFIPNRQLWGGIGLQGLVLFGLYGLGIVSAFIVAYVLRRSLTRGTAQPLLMEMPKYQLPHVRDMTIALYARGRAFLVRAGTTILISMLILWFLSHIPGPPAGATGPAIDYSIVGWMSRWLHVLFAPIGFTREMAVALVPGMAAREVAVGALAQIYALQDGADHAALMPVLQHAWSLPTALAFLAWYVFAPQCISTLAVTKRETNSWRWPAFMFGYMFAMAYAGAGITYWIARAALG